MEIAILVVTLYLTIFIVYQIGSALSNKMDTSFFHILCFLLQPFALVGVGWLYFLILKEGFDYSGATAREIVTTAIWWFLGLYVFFVWIGSQSEHQTKSGRADKRYKNNEMIGGFGVAYLIVLVVYVIILLIAFGYFFNQDGKYNFV